jgi:hypothetical protein
LSGQIAEHDAIAESDQLASDKVLLQGLRKCNDEGEYGDSQRCYC